MRWIENGCYPVATHTSAFGGVFFRLSLELALVATVVVQQSGLSWYRYASMAIL